ESFARYHAGEAWKWERMALTRARIVCGSEAIRARVTTVLAEALASPQPIERIKADAAEMREKLPAQFPGKNRWDLKFAPGGLVDIEFIAQTLQLTQAQRRLFDAN